MNEIMDHNEIEARLDRLDEELDALKEIVQGIYEDAIENDMYVSKDSDIVITLESGEAKN